MKEQFLNKSVVIIEKNNTKTSGVILYWVKEKGEREFILINNKCIYVSDIKTIEEAE